MVDQERVDRLLARVAEDLRELAGYRRRGVELLHDRTELAAAKYYRLGDLETFVSSVAVRAPLSASGKRLESPGAGGVIHQPHGAMLHFQGPVASHMEPCGTSGQPRVSRGSPSAGPRRRRGRPARCHPSRISPVPRAQVGHNA